MENFNIHEWQAKCLREGSSKQQTAVEWLVNEANLLENNGWILPLIEQAKEIEKKQIENAFDSGWNRANDTKDKAYSSAEDYGKGYYTNKYK